MIHYKIRRLGEREIKFPILNRVNYNPDHENHHHLLSEWCNQNCKEQFYWSGSWAGSFVEFEDDDDATMFALRWA